MRTTITISEEQAAVAKRLSGKERLSDAIAHLIAEEERRRKRKESLDVLFDTPLPHDWEKIKAGRRQPRGRQ